MPLWLGLVALGAGVVVVSWIISHLALKVLDYLFRDTAWLD